MNDAERLVEAMDDFVAAERIPVRLFINADSGFEVSIQSVTTSPGHRRQGHATRVMQALIEHADEFGVDLDLEALPTDEEDEISLEDLVKFYERFGFVGEIEDESAWMSRPSVPSATLKPA